MTMIVKAYDVILYNGSKLHFEVNPDSRITNMNAKQYEDMVLDNLSKQLENKSNPPCRVNFKFG